MILGSGSAGLTKKSANNSTKARFTFPSIGKAPNVGIPLAIDEIIHESDKREHSVDKNQSASLLNDIPNEDLELLIDDDDEVNQNALNGASLVNSTVNDKSSSEKGNSIDGLSVEERPVNSYFYEDNESNSIISGLSVDSGLLVSKKKESKNMQDHSDTAECDHLKHMDQDQSMAKDLMAQFMAYHQQIQLHEAHKITQSARQDHDSSNMFKNGSNHDIGIKDILLEAISFDEIKFRTKIQERLHQYNSQIQEQIESLYDQLDSITKIITGQLTDIQTQFATRMEERINALKSRVMTCEQQERELESFMKIIKSAYEQVFSNISQGRDETKAEKK